MRSKVTDSTPMIVKDTVRENTTRTSNYSIKNRGAGTMSMTIGTDLVSIDRFLEFAQDITHPVLKKMFTQNELDYCFAKETAEPHLAVRFAGKEAVIKALYSRGIEEVWYTDIEILNEQNGVPVVMLKKEPFKDLKLEISLAHCEDKALAFVVIIGED